jgi:lipoprotein-anchoring transpeptidase ErfK/SrfK
VSPTAQGEFAVYQKYEAQTMAGVGYDGTPYRQEDVPWVMYFYQDFALHGAYWRNGFGYAASHGCVNIPVPVAEELFYWADYGTRVSVHY